MRPFFSYYGSKWTVAGKLAPPQYDVVVEPFAGSAAYSVRHAVPVTHLYDLSDDICSLWDYLIHVSEDEISRLPDQLEDDLDLHLLPDGPRQLLGFWVSKGRAEVSGTLSPWYFQYRNARDCRVWGPAVKRRLIAQVGRIRRWTITQASYEQIEYGEAHWHIDPPYQGSPGRRYPHSDVDYPVLADWCRTRPGFVQVCENEGADWLPFKLVCAVVTCRGRRSGAVSHEVVYENQNREERIWNTRRKTRERSAESRIPSIGRSCGKPKSAPLF